jgi:hypothetical protein
MEQGLNMTHITDDALGEVVDLRLDEPDPDLQTAKDAAKAKAREICKDPMLLSWKNGRTGEFYPNFECGAAEKPAWIVFAEARGGDLTIRVNDGAFVFIYLKM